MANRRTLHKKISLSEQLADVSDLAKLSFTWGILHADDWGIIKGTPRGFRAEVLPLHDAHPSEVGSALDELVRARLLVRYQVNGVHYLYYPTFAQYQEGLHKRTASNRLPTPAEADPGSLENGELVSEDFREIPGNSGKPLETAGTPGNAPESPANSRLARACARPFFVSVLFSSFRFVSARAREARPELALDPPPTEQSPADVQPHAAFAERTWQLFRQPAPCPKPVYAAAGQFFKSHGQRGADLLLAAIGSHTDGFTVPDGADPATNVADRLRTATRRDFEWDPDKQRGQPQPRARPTTSPRGEIVTGRAKL